MKKPIVILGPMESESALLVQQLGNRIKQPEGTDVFHEGELDGYPVVVCRTYIGVVNAAAAAALAIRRYQPLCVIIQGTSGAHDPALHQGDIVLGDTLVHLGRFYTPHRDKGAGTDAFAWEPMGSEIAALNPDDFTPVLHSDRRILDLAAAVPYAKGHIRRGTIGAADIWNRELDMLDHLHRTLGTDCEEMEGFGVAQVCAGFGVPMANIRIISNSEWHEQEEFNEKYGEDCQMFVLEVVKRLIAENTLM